MEFIITSEIDFQQLLALNRLAGKTYRRWQSRLCRIGSALLGSALILSNALLLQGDEYYPGVVFGFLFGASLLALAAFYHHINAWGSKRQMPQKGMRSTVTINDEGFTELSELATVQHEYRVFFDLMEYRDYYFLFVDKSTPIFCQRMPLLGEIRRTFLDL